VGAGFAPIVFGLSSCRLKKRTVEALGASVAFGFISSPTAQDRAFDFLQRSLLPLPEYCRTELSFVVIRLNKMSAGASSRLLTNNYLRAFKRRKWRARQDGFVATLLTLKGALTSFVRLSARYARLGSNL
jgi:hypothetical protein